MKLFWKKKRNSSAVRHDEIINQIQALVDERRELWSKIKSSYIPEKDKKESRVWYFVNSNIEQAKISLKDLDEYEKRYNIKLPKILRRILNEIGSGKLLNHNFINNKGELFTPFTCFEIEFLQSCLDRGINPKLIEDEMLDLYDIENNSFTIPEIQSIYEERNSNRDKNIVMLFPVGGHSSYITLNKERKEKLAIFNISGICNKSIYIDNYEYDFPYYQYTEGTIEESIIQNINTPYWKDILREINEMNK